MDKLEFTPLGARVFVEKYKEEEKDEFTKTTSGLFLGATEDKNLEFERNSGKVLVLGTDLSENALKHIKVGTKIKFSNPHQISYKGVDYYLVHENNIELILTPQ